jgi:glucose-6-phosphate isomerase
MYLSYFDLETLNQTKITSRLKKLTHYREHIADVIRSSDDSAPEYSLTHAKNPALHDLLQSLTKQFKDIQHLVLVGIGGPGLGAKAVHQVLDQGAVSLHTLDTISAHETQQLLSKLQSVRSVKKLAVVIISKSGGTAETLTNAGVLLTALEKKYQKEIYQQTIFIGDAGTDFLKAGKRLGATVITMPTIVGGRYSIGTEVGLVPLTLLKHNVDSFMEGLLDAGKDEKEITCAENAVRLHHYLQSGFRHYNFFAFEPRLFALGAWYRQLQAESIGKSVDRDGRPAKLGFVPTISTPTELHSIGQLYLSGFPGVYTDFVTFDDANNDFDIPKTGPAKKYGRFSMQEVNTAIYGGVVGAYQEKNLPYRSVIFDDPLPYSLGLFMGMRMMETMYLAELLNLNAFDQPNVELYKVKTQSILGLV